MLKKVPKKALFQDRSLTPLIHRVWTLKHKVWTHIDDKEKSAGVDEDDGGGHHGHEEAGGHADLDVQCRVHTV